MGDSRVVKIKAKVYLCLIKHDVTKAYGRVELQLLTPAARRQIGAPILRQSGLPAQQKLMRLRVTSVCGSCHTAEQDRKYNRRVNNSGMFAHPLASKTAYLGNRRATYKNDAPNLSLQHLENFSLA